MVIALPILAPGTGQAQSEEPQAVASSRIHVLCSVPSSWLGFSAQAKQAFYPSEVEQFVQNLFGKYKALNYSSADHRK